MRQKKFADRVLSLLDYYYLNHGLFCLYVQSEEEDLNINVLLDPLGFD